MEGVMEPDTEVEDVIVGGRPGVTDTDTIWDEVGVSLTVTLCEGER